jgi:two-component system, LuxR family, response regulator FixJ
MTSTIKVLVVDLELPGQNGLELLKELRRSAGARCRPSCWPGESDVATAVGAIRAGAVDFIQKPVIDRILLRRVQRRAGTGRHLITRFPLVFASLAVTL